MHAILTILRNHNVYSFTLTGHSSGIMHGQQRFARQTSSTQPIGSTFETVCLSGSAEIDPQKLNLLQQHINALVQTLNTKRSDLGAGLDLQPNSIKEFESLGKVLFAQIVPTQIQQQIGELAHGATLAIVTNDVNLPWEILHDGTDFLALRLAVVRLPIVAHPPRRRSQPHPDSKISCLLLGNPTDDLPTAEEEIRAIEDILYTVRDRVRYRSFFGKLITSVHLQELLASQEYDLVHIACHARPGALRLADGWFATEQLRNELQNHPVIILSACASAQADPSAVEFSAFNQNAQSLSTTLIQAGAAAVIGMLWPIPDRTTRQWSKEFYGELVMGTTIGEALRASRVALSKDAHAGIAWLAPVLYGNPLHQVVPNLLKKGSGTLLSIRFHATMVDQQLLRKVEANDLQKYLSLLCEHVSRHGGTLFYANSEGLLAVFGLYQSLDSDAVQAINAARDVYGLATAWRVTMPTTVIASGDMLVSGQKQHRTPATASSTTLPFLFGKPVKDASQLLLMASPGQIIVNQLARERCKERFHFRLLTDATPNEPRLAAYEIISSPVDVASDRRLLNFNISVGHENEQQLLRSAWQTTVAGRGQVLGIAGEAGIGKSHLLATFKKTIVANQLHWFQVNCTTEIENTPYSLLNRLFRTLLNIPEYASPEQISHSIHNRYMAHASGNSSANMIDPTLLIDLLGDQQQDLRLQEQSVYQHQLYLLLRTLIGQELAQGPLVLVLEDTHWSDSASIAVLSHLVTNIQEVPILLLLDHRSTWTAPWHGKPYFQNISLNQFDLPTRRRLLESLLGSTHLPAELVALSERASGNPLFLSEILVSLIEKGLLVASDSEAKAADATANGTANIAAPHWQLRGMLESAELPDTVQRTIEMRLDQLDQEVRTVVEMAAVVGATFTPDMLMWGLSLAENELFDQLKVLVDHDFLRHRWGSEQYEFRHTLIRDVTYTRTPPAQRQLWHRRIAERLELRQPQSRETVAELAQHCYLSLLEETSREGALRESALREAGAHNQEHDPIQVEKTLQYLLQSGQYALDRYGAREAVTLFTRAQSVNELQPRNISRQAQIQTGLGNAYRLQNSVDQAIIAYEEAHAAFHRRPLSLETRPQSAHVTRWLARLHMWRADYIQAEAWLSSGLDHVQAQDHIGCRAAAALLNIQAGSLCYNRGDYKEAERYCRHGLAIATECLDEEALAEGNLVLGAIMRSSSNYDASLAFYAASMAIQEQRQNLYQIHRIKMNLGVVYFSKGDWTLALSFYETAFQFWKEIDEQNLLAGISINIGLIEHYQGNWERARDYYQQALISCQLIGNTKWSARAHNNLGSLYMQMAQWHDAKQHIALSWELLETHQIQDFQADVRCSQALLALSQQDWQSALKLAQDAFDIALKNELHLDQAIAMRTLGQIYFDKTELNQALTWFEKSSASLEKLKDKYELARTKFQLARTRERTGEISASVQLCSDACAIFQELGAKRDLEMVNALKAHLTQQK